MDHPSVYVQRSLGIHYGLHTQPIIRCIVAQIADMEPLKLPGSSTGDKVKIENRLANGTILVKEFVE